MHNDQYKKALKHILGGLGGLDDFEEYKDECYFGSILTSDLLEDIEYLLDFIKDEEERKQIDNTNSLKEIKKWKLK